MGSFASMMSRRREPEPAPPSCLNPAGGLPRSRLRFLYLDEEGELRAVAWDRSGEVRSIEPGDYQKLEQG